MNLRPYLVYFHLNPRAVDRKSNGGEVLQDRHTFYRQTLDHICNGIFLLRTPVCTCPARKAVPDMLHYLCEKYE